MHDYMYESLQRVLTLLTYEINCLMNGQDGEKPINNIKQSLLASKQEVVTRGLKKKERKWFWEPLQHIPFSYIIYNRIASGII